VIHLVEAVTFVPRTNDGPLDCSCGESMLASEFAQHRRDSGLLTSKPHKAVPSEKEMPSAWRRPLKTCEFPGCKKGLKARGLCQGHYDQQKKGQPLRALRYYGVAA
jgi:hypothetical protein